MQLQQKHGGRRAREKGRGGVMWGLLSQYPTIAVSLCEPPTPTLLSHPHLPISLPLPSLPSRLLPCPPRGGSADSYILERSTDFLPMTTSPAGPWPKPDGQGQSESFPQHPASAQACDKHIQADRRLTRKAGFCVSRSWRGFSHLLLFLSFFCCFVWLFISKHHFGSYSVNTIHWTAQNQSIFELGSKSVRAGKVIMWSDRLPSRDPHVHEWSKTQTKKERKKAVMQLEQTTESNSEQSVVHLALSSDTYIKHKRRWPADLLGRRAAQGFVGGKVKTCSFLRYPGPTCYGWRI